MNLSETAEILGAIADDYDCSEFVMLQSHEIEALKVAVKFIRDSENDPKSRNMVYEHG